MRVSSFEPAVSRKTLAGLLSLTLLGVFFVAGWWPFHVPKNGVSWLKNGSGVRLHSPAILWTQPNVGETHALLRTIEIWVTPSREHEGGTILAFETKASRHFGISQSESCLELCWPAHGYRRRYLWVPETFQRGRAVAITLVSGENGVAVYVNGAFKRRYNGFRFSDSEVAGHLVVGSSPTGSSWNGELQEVALYTREFSPGEVRQRFREHTIRGKAAAVAKDILARYLFDEGTGAVIRDHGPNHLDLVIPPRFEVLSHRFLDPFWRRDFRFTLGFWEDVLLNVLGFIPFGFIVCAYVAETRTTSAAIWIAILFGFVVSLTIESVQVYLPTRCSDSRDILTNTLGTVFGAGVYAYRPVRSLYECCADHLLAVWNAARRRRSLSDLSTTTTEGASRVASD